MLPPQHPRQDERLTALRRYQILDTDRDPDFDEVVELASRICETPISVINLIDIDRQWFKAEIGLGVRSTPLDTSLCAHAILENDFVEIPDTQADPRMSDNPLCYGEPPLRFYAGALLKTADGLPIGTLCILDYKVRSLTQLQRQTLTVLARQVMRQIELRQVLRLQETLRLEIDHRVKNSLQSVGAIVRLQRSRSNNVDVRQALATVGDRIQTIAALHEEFHSSAENESVELGAFMTRLAGLISGSIPPGIALTTDFEPLSVDFRQANAIGIIANEFAANAAKHAFPDGARGHLSISGRHHEGCYRLVLEDDGVADATSIAAISASAGLGTRLMAASAQTLRTVPIWEMASPGLRLILPLPNARSVPADVEPAAPR